jgi:hypothetical protein
MRSLPMLAAPMLAAPMLAALPLACFALSTAEAQGQNPQILGFQAGCFIRHDQPYSIIVKVGPSTTSYRFIFTNVANQQVVHDQVSSVIHAGQEVPFRLPDAGNYSFTVKYPSSVGNQTATTSAYNLTVKPVMVATVNGQKVCRDATPVTLPSTQQPTTR